MRDVDEIIDRIRRDNPSVTIQQLKVVHPGADDDGVWFFQQPDSEFEVQIESSSGMCPFLVESDESAKTFTGNTIEATVELIRQLLRLDSV